MNRSSATSRPIAAATASSGWQAELRAAVRTTAELERLLGLPAGSLGTANDTSASFPLLVPRSFVARMRPGDPDDPLLRQILPVAAEQTATAGFGPDPLAESTLARHGMLQKYAGRVLLVTTAACPVHCRYCFRREFPYAEQTAGRDRFAPAIDAIRQMPGIREVILSGGDPLSLGNDRLNRLIGALETLPELTTLRLHTRFPVVLPSRVDDGLIELLGNTRLNTVVVIHANHPAEIDAGVAAAAARLRKSTRMLLNQSVLLRGVNDRADVLIRLGERLLDIGVTPYYLHLLDRVTGAAHFEVDAAAAAGLVAELRRRAPGYLVPRLVREVAGELSKTPIGTIT